MNIPRAAIWRLIIGCLSLVWPVAAFAAAKPNLVIFICDDLGGLDLTLPCEPVDCMHTYYLYTLLVPKEWAGEKRDRLMTRLREQYQAPR